MNPRAYAVGPLILLGFATCVSSVSAQPPGGGGGRPGGPGGFGPPGGQENKLLKQYDKDGNGWLNAEERQAAREALKNDGGDRRRGPGGPGGFGRGNQEPGKPGPHVSPVDVKAYPDSGLFEPTVLRTLFLTFESNDWEAELEAFHNTDVKVPATLTVDGKTYPNVGVHFRGMSSYGMVPRGSKRSLSVAIDLADSKQRLYGAKSLNLLNAHEDASFLSTVLYSRIARQHIPAPKANFVKVVINGESWGVYASAQQFDKVFLAENYKASKGTRWKVRGSPMAGAGLEYLGDDVEKYKRKYEMKGGDDEKAWKAFVEFCKVLNTTPPDKLEAALKPVLDVDGLLWFLALDVALVNNDGYWVRASDYSLFLDDKGVFHVVPHDMNEAFKPGGGPGGPGGMFRMPRPGEVLPPPLQDALRLTDDQKKQLADLQKEVDGKLDAIFTSEQRQQVKEMRERGPGGFGPPGMAGPGGPPGGPGGPGGFGPGGPGGGPGGPGGGRGGVELDPLVALNDTSKPLRSKILAVPAWRAQYLRNVRAIADESLDWKNLGPVVTGFRTLIEKEVEADTRKLESTEAFRKATADDETTGRGREMPLRAFADQRRKYLLDYPEVKKAGR